MHFFRYYDQMTFELPYAVTLCALDQATKLDRRYVIFKIYHKGPSHLEFWRVMVSDHVLPGAIDFRGVRVRNWIELSSL